MFYVYILKCADESYYVGMTENLEQRLTRHDHHYFKNSYTRSRLPVELIWQDAFANHDDAFRCERQIKGWSRAKKEAMIRGDWNEVQRLAKNYESRGE